MKISEVAKLTGLTVRALHYYDEIGLLKPGEVTNAGYRVYSDADLEILQQILFFRELDFPLNDIKEIMLNPNYDKEIALQKHKELLLQKRERIDDLIVLIEQTLKGECDMSFKEFDKTAIEDSKRQYAAEAKQRWGKTDAYAEYEAKTKKYDDNKWNATNDESNAILSEFGQIRHLDPAGQEAQALVQKWQDHITRSYYTCTKQILAGLGQMYVGDERFMKNIDKHGEGTAAFMAAAIEVFCRE